MDKDRNSALEDREGRVTVAAIYVAFALGPIAVGAVLSVYLLFAEPIRGGIGWFIGSFIFLAVAAGVTGLLPAILLGGPIAYVLLRLRIGSWLIFVLLGAAGGGGFATLTGALPPLLWWFIGAGGIYAALFRWLLSKEFARHSDD